MNVNRFDDHTEIGIIGFGETIETCFADIARVMCSLIFDVENIHLIQIITFEFEEADLELGLQKWLNLLLAKADEHQLMIGDFRLKREGTRWQATVSGEPWRKEIERGLKVKGVRQVMLSVKKIDHKWEARCLLDV